MEATGASECEQENRKRRNPRRLTKAQGKSAEIKYSMKRITAMNNENRIVFNLFHYLN